MYYILCAQKLILLIGTKLHRVVVKLAVEITDKCPSEENNQINLRDDLFWFGKPKILLRLIQLISFQVSEASTSIVASIFSHEIGSILIL